ncbi:hypothetical protein V6N11_020517 [Hibiscus sabdariffa]|uniref:Uncharacterized protein n=1 Tax=Hibiscus sabdariffa TaxID=183260 RepID=A0ABR2Q8L8_9ROSI
MTKSHAGPKVSLQTTSIYVQNQVASSSRTSKVAHPSSTKSVLALDASKHRVFSIRDDVHPRLSSDAATGNPPSHDQGAMVE